MKTKKARAVARRRRYLERKAAGLAGSSAIRDPTPQPLGTPYPCARFGESDEARVWRRFPVSDHKPG